MQRFLYTSLYYLLTPLLFMRLLLKHRKSAGYKTQRQSLRLAERLGFFKPPEFSAAMQPIWLHTVSVGEFLAARPLIHRLLRDYPDYPLVITCTTTTGSAQILSSFAEQISQGRIFHCYLPYDLPGSMHRFLNKTNPCLGLIMETEIWPNLLLQCEKRQLPVWLLNARMSARSASGYARFKQLTQSTLQQFAGIAAQDTLDAGRLKELGADEKKLHITGSIKFDIKVMPEDIQQGQSLRQQLQWQDKTVLIAASTHKGEDELILEIFKDLRSQYPELVLLLVPRHPERFQSVYQLLCDHSQLKTTNLKVLKRTQLDTYSNTGQTVPVDILLGDSMGEMMCYLACSDLVFMGGTLVPVGGHNILEPAALGLAIVYGPHIFNFYAINELFLQYQAARQVRDAAELEQVLEKLLSNKRARQAMAEKARYLIEQNAGALDKMLALIRPFTKSQ